MPLVKERADRPRLVAVLVLVLLAATAWTAGCHRRPSRVPFDGRVVGVSDRDTVTVLDGTTPVKVRLNGIDCPERGHATQRHVRWDQGRMASSVSQRHNVVSPTDATRPRRITSRLMSGILKRDNGRPLSWGSSHASAFTATTTLGGKAGRTPAACQLFEACETVLEISLTPFADDLSRRVQASSDLVITQPLGGIKNYLGADDISIR